MNTYLKKIVKSVMIPAAAVVFLTLSHGVARAEEVNFTGSSGGCFAVPLGSACTPPAGGQAQTASLLGLHYHGSTFDVTTSNSFAGVGNSGTPGSNFNNFGSFTLDSTPNNYSGEFVLRISFTSPSGTDPSRPPFEGSVIGSVTSTNAGGVQLFNFSRTTQKFETLNGGAFEVTVNPVAITAGQGPVALTGNIRAVAAPVPEPATLVLLGTGLAGVAARIRRRKSRAKA